MVVRGTDSRKFNLQLETMAVVLVSHVSRHHREQFGEAGITFFRSAARGLQVPAKLTPELTKREARKRRASERPRAGCCEEFYESDCQGRVSSLLIAFWFLPLQSALSDPARTIVSACGWAVQSSVSDSSPAFSIDPC